MSRAKPKPDRWYRWRFNHNSGTPDWHYTFGSRSAAEEALYEHCMTRVPHSAHWRGGEVRAVKRPPRAWLEAEFASSLRAHNDALDWHRFIIAELRATDPS